MNENSAPNVDFYIAGFPSEAKEMMFQLREVILNTAPEAQELISYQMPAYKLNGMLVYFAGYKNHVGFYPGKATIETFHKELSAYKTSAGTVQFPINQPLPLNLIVEMVKFKIAENLTRKNEKLNKK